jgi:hypothetical protein
MGKKDNRGEKYFIREMPTYTPLKLGFGPMIYKYSLLWLFNFPLVKRIMI